MFTPRTPRVRGTKAALTDVPRDTKAVLTDVPTDTKAEFTDVPTDTKVVLTDVPTDAKARLINVPTDTKAALTNVPAISDGLQQALPSLFPYISSYTSIPINISCASPEFIRASCERPTWADTPDPLFKPTVQEGRRV